MAVGSVASSPSMAMAQAQSQNLAAARASAQAAKATGAPDGDGDHGVEPAGGAKGGASTGSAPSGTGLFLNRTA
jgi:hypothetical protein